MAPEDPVSALRFRVEIRLPGAGAPLCDAAFSECDGLEIGLDVRTVHEGGDAGRQRLLPGPVSYGRVVLRRGMTSSFDLWRWSASVVEDPSVRADARVVVLAGAGDRVHARFALSRCLPVRLKAPRLDAVEGLVAVEELELACERLVLEGAAPRAPRVAKAQLSESGGDRRAVVQFNPERLHLSHRESGPALSMRLHFEAPAGGDVRERTAPLAELAAPGRAVRFSWARLRFDGRVEALEETLDAFAPDGRALRAYADLVLREDPPAGR